MLSTLLPLLWPLLATVLTAAVVSAVLAWRKKLAADPKTVPLSDALDVAGMALEAAIKAAGAAGPTPAAIKAAEAATFNVLAAHKGQLEDDAAAELKVLCTHAVALEAGQPVTAPGGATVEAPTPIQGMVSYRMLFALATLGLGVLFAWGFRRVRCAVLGHRWEGGPLRCGRCGRKPPLPKVAAIAVIFLALGLGLPARAQTVAAPASSTVKLQLSPVDWKTVVFSHGPSLPLIVVNPKDLHPVQIAPGAGYSAGACLGQTTINGSPLSLLCLSGQLFLSVISPDQVPEGGVQAALMVGTLSNAVAIGPILTPWTASGGGFLQGGRPGTSWAATLNPVALWHLAGGG